MMGIKMMQREDIIKELTQKEDELENHISTFWLDGKHIKPGSGEEIKRLVDVRRFISNLRHSFRFHPEPNYILRTYHREIESLLGRTVSEVI